MEALLGVLVQLVIIFFAFWIMLRPIAPALDKVWKLALKALKITLQILEFLLTSLLALVRGGSSLAK